MHTSYFTSLDAPASVRPLTAIGKRNASADTARTDAREDRYLPCFKAFDTPALA